MGAKRTSSTGVPTSRPISIKRGRLSGGSLISATVAVAPKATDVSGWRASAIGLDGRGGESFDEDGFRQFFADAQAGIADLADEAGLAGEQLDFLLLAETHLAQPMRDILRGGKPFDAHHSPFGDMTQGTNFRPGAFAFQNCV